MQRINTFSAHCKKKYGMSIGKIVVDLGQICPNRKRGGCIFCSPEAFSPEYVGKRKEVDSQLELGKKQLYRTRYRKYFAYFQQETCTAPPIEKLISVVQQCYCESDCVGIILSTRPDFIAPTVLDEIASLVKTAGKECLFELGLQSSRDASLKFLNRNHTVADFEKAVQAIKKYELFSVGAHLLFGIPGETEEDMTATVQYISALGIDAVKMHHLQILYDTPLYKMYLRHNYPLFSLDSYMDFLIKILPLLQPSIVIHRLWATAHPRLLVGPKWNISATRLRHLLDQKLVQCDVYQGASCPSFI